MADKITLLLFQYTSLTCCDTAVCTNTAWRGASTCVGPEKLLDSFKWCRRVFGHFRTPSVHLSATGFCHLLDIIMVCRYPHTRKMKAFKSLLSFYYIYLFWFVFRSFLLIFRHVLVCHMSNITKIFLLLLAKLIYTFINLLHFGQQDWNKLSSSKVDHLKCLMTTSNLYHINSFVPK